MPKDTSNQRSQSSLSIEDGRGEELTRQKQGGSEQVVVATDSRGKSLTLLEELAHRKNKRVSPADFAISILCATASLAFAALIYLNTH